MTLYLAIGAMLICGGVLVEVLPTFQTDSVTRKALGLVVVMAGIVILDLGLK